MRTGPAFSLHLGVLLGAGLLPLRRRHPTRRRLNELLHEMRRPLQAMALCAGDEDEARLEQLAAALADLDGEVNGRPAGAGTSGSLAAIVASAERRWRFSSALATNRGSFEGTVGADAGRIGAALDNLIANGIEHGRGAVALGAARRGDHVILTVSNESPRPADRPSRSPEGGDPRRGHGLRLAARIAREAGGRLHGPRRERGRVVAALELPLVEGRANE